MHGVNKEVRWGVGGGQGSCGKRYGGCGGRCKEMCWGVGEVRGRGGGDWGLESGGWGRGIVVGLKLP